ncbi:putative protein ECERIFERUM 1-like [Capsicum annuum]|nr:putative protein ECERIFERUM 1-like [Capsicum annuum]KAF3642335.1 putative protein ECERIFERUM 1-like [Capsicum annuum]
MLEKTKKRKSFVTEEDMSTLLQRYPATTVLGMLQEVGQVADEKIDWDALVRKSTTGITNAREYQMLWRHLAYRHVLLDKLEDWAEPLDDDSDLEYELEAFPAVSSEASAEAAACVKVLIASGVPNDANMLNGSTVEAPLTINIPNGQTSRTGMDNSFQGTSMHGTNITVPVAVQKQPLSTMAAEGLDTHGPACTNVHPRRKRKPWSTAEDMELIAAVQKCGEGNWANILKGDFKGDRTASQLSQMYNAFGREFKGCMPKPFYLISDVVVWTEYTLPSLDSPLWDYTGDQCGVQPGFKSMSATVFKDVIVVGHFNEELEIQSMGFYPFEFLLNGTWSIWQFSPLTELRWAIIRKRQGAMAGNGSQLSEAQLAARRAMSIALNMPMGDNLKAVGPIGAGVGPNSGGGPSTSSHPVTADFASGGAQSQHQQDLSSSKPRVVPQKPTPKPTTSSDSMVKVAAAAAGACIATSTNSAPLLKVAQPKAALQIPGGDPTVKSCALGTTNGLPSNVHFIRTGLVSHSAGPPASRPGTQKALGHSLKPASPTVQPKLACNSSRPNALAEPNAPTCAPAAELKVKQVLQKVQQDQTPPSANPVMKKADELKEYTIEDREPVTANASGVQVQEKLISLPSREIASNDISDSNKAPARTENGSANGGDPSKEPAKTENGKSKME